MPWSRKKEEQERGDFISHVIELRSRLLKVFFLIFLGCLICWNIREILFDIIRRPIQIHLPTQGFVFTAPMDKFLAHIKVSLIGGLILMAPFWIYQVWRFISPGLYAKERKISIFFVFFGTLLFFCGLFFVYFLVYPLAFQFLMHFGGDTDLPMITISHYLSFFLVTSLAFGFAFELPLVLSFLGFINVISSSDLRKKRKYAIPLLMTLSALITPPDVLSMILLSIPLIFLYEVSIFLVQILEKKVKVN